MASQGAKEFSLHLWPFKPVIGQSASNLVWLIDGVLEQLNLNMVIFHGISQNESFLMQLQNLKILDLYQWRKEMEDSGNSEPNVARVFF